MLSIAIATFFALAFAGALFVITIMFVQYRGKILSVIESEFSTNHSAAILPQTTYRHRTVKTPQLMKQYRSAQPVPLRVAA